MKTKEAIAGVRVMTEDGPGTIIERAANPWAGFWCPKTHAMVRLDTGDAGWSYLIRNLKKL